MFDPSKASSLQRRGEERREVIGNFRCVVKFYQKAMVIDRAFSRCLSPTQQGIDRSKSIPNLP
jgi:hypothetical protein